MSWCQTWGLPFSCRVWGWSQEVNSLKQQTWINLQRSQARRLGVASLGGLAQGLSRVLVRMSARAAAM